MSAGDTEFPVTKCPPGNAYGCFHMRNRGKALAREVTIWPSSQSFILFDGSGRPRAAICQNGHWLWNQELYVYLRERREQCIEAVDRLDRTAWQLDGEDQGTEPLDVTKEWYDRWVTEARTPKVKQLDPQEHFGEAIEYFISQLGTL